MTLTGLPNIGLPSFLITLLLTRPARTGLRVFTTSTGICTLLTIALQLLIDPRAIAHHAGVCAGWGAVRLNC